ncbi:CAP domain-containing protein [Robertmurraya massiliosenegalensis]|uniref:CAP domain-containing protein n=1 Tax=Robertmurraya massiliosenegalensis TaxID=1287657 RepID=UPI000301E3E5|nr:CAP domain-containing protein [Robertmurraya massiliosenegalensis]
MRGGKPLRALIRILVLIAAVLAVVFYLNLSFGEEILVNEHPDTPQEDKTLVEETKDETDNPQIEAPTTGLATLIGKEISLLEERLGKPSRVDESAYGYEWWIYKKSFQEYIQVGVRNEKVVTLYAIGNDVDITPFKLGQPVEEIYASVPIGPYISLMYDGSSYRFELTENDMNTRPLVQMGDFYAQFYIDKFDGTLSSVRFMDAETLIKLQPYELAYVGELVEVKPWEKGSETEIANGNAEQIFDISNVMRVRHQLNPLEKDEMVAEVALAHSIDMYESDDFSHTSKTSGELSDRLEAGEVFYQLAGENIAANYADAPAVMEGWLNSKGHRETLLNGEFTHIGVGVYNLHYTQNFIQKWTEK